MEPLSARAVTSQLADDLTWLERHCLRQPAQARAASALRLASAMVRNCIGPLLDDQPPTPLHVVVVGGAGAGKSTVANLLSGAPAAETNPQAGFTRHPVAYTSLTGPTAWAGHLGFLGPLQRLTEPGPSSLDADVYQVRNVAAEPALHELLPSFVVWDCPDMTTWAAVGSTDGRGGYILRLLEAAALADVLIYVASDERYNDEAPTQFLRLLLQAGKPVIAVLTKMRETEIPALVGHFQQEVVSHLPRGVIGCLAIPHLSKEELSDPARTAARHRTPLLNQVAVLLNPPALARRRSVHGAANYLVQNQEVLLGVARDDLAALSTWQAVVQAGRNEFEQRYQREYLTGEKFRGFDEALVRLLELLELPGFGQVVSRVLYVVRTPYRLLRGMLGKAMARPEAPGRPELPVLEDALTGWLDQVHKEAARRAGSNPLWSHVANGFTSGGLAEHAHREFQRVFRDFQLDLAAEVERTARAIYEELEKKPGVLNSMRYGKLALDTAAIGGTLVAGGIGWSDLILVPLVASLTHQLVEVLGQQVVEAQREQTRQRQQALLRQHVSGPLAEWLTRWPATGGSEFERLQTALRRIPESIRQVADLVRAKETQ